MKSDETLRLVLATLTVVLMGLTFVAFVHKEESLYDAVKSYLR